MPTAIHPTRLLEQHVNTDDCGTVAATTKLHPTPYSLDALHPMPLLPNRLVRRRALAVMALQRIESLEVFTSRSQQGHARHEYYHVDVYYRDAHSRIPVHETPQLHATVEAKNRPHVEPSTTLHVGFDDFLQLRQDAYEFARRSHVDSTCAFCRDVILLNTVSAAKPRWRTRWLKSDRAACALLTTYLTELLRICIHVPTSGVDPCRGQERVPRLLQLFLRSHESERHSF